MSFGNRDSEARLGGSPFMERRVSDDEEANADDQSIDDSSSRAPKQRRAEQRIYQRPVFDACAKQRECRLLGIVHAQISQSGLRDTETLTDAINEACKNEGATENIFERSSEFVKFIDDRSFIFERKVTDMFVRNTGFAHREGMVCITRFVQQNSYSLHGCRLKDLTKYIIHESQRGAQEGKFPTKPCFTVYNPDDWEDQHWDDSYFFFYNWTLNENIVLNVIKQYKEYFSITEAGETFVGLLPLAFTVPSLWHGELLPERPQKGYYDRSRVEPYLVDITATTQTYAKGVIYFGKYEGRRVYFLHKNIGLLNVDLNQHMPTDLPVFCCAHMTLGLKNDLNAVNVSPIDINNRKFAKQIERADIDLDAEVVVPPAANTSSVLSEDVLAQKRDLREMIANEQAQIKFIDKILADGPCTDEELFSKIGRETGIFPRAYDGLEFIMDRPYLYELVEKTASARPALERKTFTALFEFMHDSGKDGITYDRITQQLKAGKGGDFLQKIVMEGNFDALLKTVKPFMGKVYRRDPQRIHLTLMSTFDKASKTLLPYYANCGPHLSTR